MYFLSAKQTLFEKYLFAQDKLEANNFIFTFNIEILKKQIFLIRHSKKKYSSLMNWPFGKTYFFIVLCAYRSPLVLFIRNDQVQRRPSSTREGVLRVRSTIRIYTVKTREATRTRGCGVKDNRDNHSTMNIHK